MANWEYFDENDNKINVQQSSSNWEYFDENDKPIQTTQQSVVKQQPVRNIPAQPQVVQDTPAQSQTVKNNDGTYTLKTGIQKKTPVGSLKSNWNTFFNESIKPKYETATKWLWHKGGQGLRAALPKKALIPFLSEDWWFGTDEQNARLKQLDEVARQTGYYDQNAVRNDFMKGKLSRRQANAYAQMVGERENLLQDLNYIKGARGGNTAEGIVTNLAALAPGGSFKTVGGAVGKLGFNALKNVNASKNLALGGGKVARYLTQHGLRGGQIGAEMAVLKNTYENMAGIEHDPFAKELVDNMLLAAGADIALPIAFKGASAVGKQLGKGIEAGANKWESTANNFINNPYATDLQRGIGQTMNSIGGAATNLGATAKRFLTSDLNKVDVLGSRVNRKARLDNALAELANEDAHLRNINPEVLRELDDISDEASQETINALLKGVDLDGNPLEPSEAYKSIMNIINEARIKKGLQPHEYSNGWKEPGAEPSVTPEATPEYQYPVADVEDTILLRKTGLIDDNALVNDLSEAGLDSEQILQVMEENGFTNKPITPEVATKTQTPQSSPVDTNDTEVLVDKLNELNSHKTNTGNSRYDNWIAKNKQKHAEGSGSPVKNETGINTHEHIETPQNEPASHVKTNNTKRQLPEKIVEKEYEYKQPLEDMKVTKLEPGDAEGSHTSMRDLSLERPDKVETHTGGDKPSEYKGEIIDEVYNAGSHVNEEVPLTNRYASDDAEFNKWFDKYEKADSETRIKMQKEKMTDFNSQEESMDFYEKFTEQVDRDKRIAERNQTSPSVTEDDIMSFASNYKAADILPSATKQAKIAEREMSDKAALEHGTEIMKMFGYGNGTKGVNSSIARSVSKSKGKSANKTLTRLINARLNNFKSKLALDKYVEQKIAEFDKIGGNIAARAKMLLKDAYKELSEKRGYIKKNNSNLKSDLAYRNQQTRKIDTYSSPSDLSNRKTFALDVLYDHIKELGASIKDGDVQEIGLSIKNAVDIRTGKHFLSTNQNISSYFGSKHRSLIDNIKVIITNHLKESNGRAAGRFDTILIKNGSNIEKEFNHETQHIIDYQTEIKIDNLPDGNPIKDAKKLCDNVYNNALDKCKKLGNTIDNVRNSLNDLEFAQINLSEPTKENIGTFNIDKFKKVVNSIFGKDSENALREIEYAEAKINYLKDPREIRSYNAENSIQNTEKLEDALLNRANELKGQNNGLNRTRNNGTNTTTKPDLSRSGRFNEENTSTSSRKTNMGNDATISRGNKTGQKSTSEQPVGLKFLREQTENTYKETAKDFDVKKGTTDKNYLNKYINNIKTKANDAENASRKRHLATDAQILGRLEMTGADTYLAPTQKKLAEEKATFTLKDIKNVLKETLTGESSVSRTDKVKEVFGHKQSHAERVRSLQQQYVNTELRKAKVLGVDKVLNEVESMPETVPVKDGKILPGHVGIKQGIMANTLATGRGKDFYKLLDEGNPDKIMQAFVKPEHLEIDRAASENLRTKFPDLFDSKGYFRINSKLDPEIMLKKTPEAKQAYRAARHFIEIANMEKEYTYQVPKHIYDTLCGLDNEKVASAFKHYGLTKGTVAKGFGALVDVPTNLFKRAVLSLSTNWNIGNRINNPVLMYAHEGNVRSLFKHYMDAFKLKQKDLPPELFDNNLFEASKLRDTLDNITGDEKVDAWLGLLSGNSVSKGYINNGIGKVLKATTLAKRILFKLGDANMKLNEMFENFERKVAYAKQLDDLADKNFCKNVGGNIIKQTMTLSERNSAILKNPQIRKFVVDRVQDTLGDFSMMTPMEKNICKRVFPFYAWLRTINRSIYKLASDNPTKALMMLKTINDIKEDDIYHKEWQKGSIDIDNFIDTYHLPIKHPKLTRDGSKTVINPMKYLNYYDTHEEMARPGSGLNPFVNNTIESVTGKSLFTGRTLNSKRYISVRMGKKDALFDSKTKKFLKDKEGNLTDKLPGKAKLAKFGVGTARLLVPEMNSSLVDIEKALSIYLNRKSKDTWKSQAGNAIEFDKKYDDSFGGFSHDDLDGYYQNKKGEYKTVKRFASSKYNGKGQLWRHFTSLIQEELPLNTEEKITADYKKRERDKRIAAWKTRNNKKK